MSSTRKHMYCLLFFASISVCIVEISAWISIGKIPIKDGKCDPGNGKLYAIGEKWYNNEDCFEITCIQGNKGSVAQQVASCPVHAVKQKCRLTFPKGVQYPKCCPYYDCSKK